LGGRQTDEAQFAEAIVTRIVDHLIVAESGLAWSHLKSATPDETAVLTALAKASADKQTAHPGASIEVLAVDKHRIGLTPSPRGENSRALDQCRCDRLLITKSQPHRMPTPI
jgi:hypothetical protein